MSPRIATATVAALLVVASCRSARPPAEELAIAEREIDAGETVRGVRRMEAALEALGETDPWRWNRLGQTSVVVEDDVAARAFARAEQLRWPDPSPRAVTRLSLPFEGTWRVTQGNRGAFSHRRLADRFAWDFQRIDARGAASPGAAAAPAAFFAFGSPVLAPADGVVERAVDGVPDNHDGTRNHIRAAGNFVVIRHAEAEMTHLCHLERGSVTVRAGDAVVRGQMVGRCGASGNALEPHLHFVLRVGPTSDCLSVPMRFADSRVVRRASDAPSEPGVPEAGDVVAPAR